MYLCSCCIHTSGKLTEDKIHFVLQKSAEDLIRTDNIVELDVKQIVSHRLDMGMVLDI